jgi:hypothetical protein
MSEVMTEEKLVAAAYALLAGIAEHDEHRLPNQKYLEALSPEERAARRALAMLLASDNPLDSLIRRLLAGLFDPTFEFSTRPKGKNAKAVERRLEFTQPSRRAVEHNRRLQIGFELWCAMGKPKIGAVPKRGTKASAIGKLVEKYGIDEKTIRDAYKYATRTLWIDEC